jgi:hypothetical protein
MKVRVTKLLTLKARDNDTSSCFFGEEFAWSRSSVFEPKEFETVDEAIKFATSQEEGSYLLSKINSNDNS